MIGRIKVSRIVFVLIIVVIFAYAFFGDFECVYLKYFHIICPGCGMTRAVRALFQLDFYNAFTYHPMVFSMPLVILYILLNGKVFRRKWLDNSILIAIGVGFVINYVIKLIHFFA